MHTLTYKQQLDAPIEEVWDFMQNPNKLEEISPKSMKFRVNTKLENEPMYNGQIINYTVSPLFGIPLNWTSELKHIRAPFYFVDQQIEGPYKIWHHQHFLKDMGNNKTEITDIVNYKIRGGIVGRILNKLFVRYKLDKIFSYRHHKLEEIFNLISSA